MQFEVCEMHKWLYGLCMEAFGLLDQSDLIIHQKQLVGCLFELGARPPRHTKISLPLSHILVTWYLA